MLLMKNIYFKINLELFGLQVFFAVLSAIFSVYFSWMENWEWIYSAFTGWLFLGALHSTLRQLGIKDYKNNIIANNHLKDGELKIKLDYLRGAKICASFFIINILVTVISYIFDNGTSMGEALYFIHRFMLLPLAGFLPNTESVYYLPVSLLMCFIMYLPCITAYIMGAKNIGILEKLVPKIIYKNK